MNIRVSQDGNQVAALLGLDLATGFSGFGDDLPAALEDLARDLRSAPGEYEGPERARLRAWMREALSSHGKIHLVD